MLVDEENKVISNNARFVVANDIDGKVPSQLTSLKHCCHVV